MGNKENAGSETELAKEILNGASLESRNLVLTMALTGVTRGQKTWLTEMRSYGLHEDESGKPFTGVRISVAMKSLKAKGFVESPTYQSAQGVWLREDCVYPVLVAWAAEDRDQFSKALKARKKNFEKLSQTRNRFDYYRGYVSDEELELSAISICLAHFCLGEWEELEAFFITLDDPQTQDSIARLLCFRGDWDTLTNFSEPFVSYLARVAFSQVVMNLDDPKPLLGYLEDSNFLESFRDAAELKILQGNFENAEKIAILLEQQTQPEARYRGAILKAWLAFLQNKDEEVLSCYERSMAALVEGTRKKKAYPRGLSAIFSLLGMIRSPDKVPASKPKQFLKWGQEIETGFVELFLDAIQIHFDLKSLRDESTIEQNCEHLLDQVERNGQAPLWGLFNFLVIHWNAPEVLAARAGKLLPEIKDYITLAEKHGFRWVAMELLEMAAAINSDAKTAKEAKRRASAIRDSLAFSPSPLIDLIKPESMWEKSIAALETLVESTAKSSNAAETKETLLLWGLHKSYYECDYDLIPYERTRLKSGKWSVPKRISQNQFQNRYCNETNLPSADLKLIAAVNQNLQIAWRGYGELSVPLDQVVFELVNHPAIYRSTQKPDLSRPVRFEEIKPNISVSEAQNGDLLLRVSPFEIDLEAGEVIFVEKENDLIEFCRATKTLLHLCNTFSSERSRRFPPEAKEKLGRLLGRLSGSILVEGDASAILAEGAKEVSSDDTIHFRMVPQHEGMNVAARVLPLGAEGPVFAPGRGSEAVFHQTPEGPVRSIRNLKSEQSAIRNLVAQSSLLTALQNRDELVWNLPDLESCLQFLLEIRDLPEEMRPILEWPEGESISLEAVASSESFSLRLNSRSDWLEASGELAVDEDTVITLQSLLRLMSASEGSRFIPLGDGRFFALTERLRQQVQDIGALSKESKDDGETFRLPALTAHLLEEFAEESGAKTNAAWKERIDKLEEASKLKIPIPSTLQADLRPYQKEGFLWLARLAHWSSGACLADDMGLGKTIQALALLLRRASDGPALIVAPVSVAANWADEVQRFAPTLNASLFRGPNRADLLKNPGPRDLIIATYGLLQTESDLFAEVDWNTVVIDEAQAIKNRKTLRYKAASRLSAKFRLITTGTPIENHLEELYNLFQFTHPGLLGSPQEFQRKFATPIEQGEDARTRDRLRRLINPFLLRRLKRDVLRDLPEKTEITLQVDLSEEETAFYEALRRNAIEALSEHDDEKGAVRILAELMKLRRACCNPALVERENAPPSSKLKVFRNTLTELLSNGHKVLVFSQFVDHLSLLRAHLDSEKIPFQYLDGSTSAKKRKTAIDAFQSGDGDVFLISLKAGGFGLNLTAADYVIHMDPWWNPAVEDQASDRAHRIGQKRPVTIYRLVTSGTIEEKIMALHHQKRELADSLLTGTDSATKLNAEELRKLLTED